MAKINLLGVVLFMLCACISTAQSYMHQQESLPCVRKKMTIVAHVFKDSLGQDNVTQADIVAAIQGLNDYFNPIQVSFELCDYRVLPTFEHDTVNTMAEVGDIVSKYNINYRINFYFARQLNIISGEAGFAFGLLNPTGGTAIFIDKDDGVNASTFGHEMGHFLTLAHTFEGNGVELVNSTNCATAGDGICDTPADPFVPGEPMLEYVQNCRFISLKKDANGEYYNPDLGNIMSYYECNTCGFTWQQLDKMAQYILANCMTIW